MALYPRMSTVHPEVTVLEHLRVYAAWTREDLSSHADVSVATIKAIETLAPRSYRMATAVLLAKALQVEVMTLFEPDFDERRHRNHRFPQ